MRILLQAFSFMKKNGNYNSAVLFLHSTLCGRPNLASQIEVKLVQSDYFDEVEVVSREIRSWEPDLVGFSVSLWSLGMVETLVADCAELPRKPIIVVGGRAVSGENGGFLERNPGVDVCVDGPGEEVFARLIEHFLERPLRARNLEGIPGIAFRDARDKVVRNAPMTSYLPLGTVPSPYRGQQQYRPPFAFSIETQRYCPFHCNYCGWHNTCGNDRTNAMSLGDVAAELRWAVSNGYRDIRIWDAALNNDTARFLGLLDILDEVSASVDFCMFLFHVKHELLNQRQMERFLSSKATAIISTSIESFSEEALRIVHRSGRVDRFKSVIEMLYAKKTPQRCLVNSQLVLGLPGDNLATFIDALEYFRRFRRMHVSVSPLMVLPGTEFAENAEHYGLTCREVGLPFLEHSDDFSAEQMQQGLERVEELRRKGHLFELNPLWVPIRRIRNQEAIPPEVLRTKSPTDFVYTGVIGLDNGYVDIAAVYNDVQLAYPD